MKKGLILLLTLTVFVPLIVRAEPSPVVNEEDDEGMFISLTRTGKSPASLPSQRSVVSREEIQRSGAKTLGEAMDLVPGVVINRTGTLGNQTTLRLRGVPNSNQVQILIDGQPAAGVGVQNVDLSQIPTTDIERIEIVRGGSSVLYGANAMGGLVNIITRRHREKNVTTDLSASYGSFKTQSFSGQIGGASEKYDGFLSAARTLSDGFQENSDFDGINVSGQAGMVVGQGGKLSVNMTRTDNEVGTPSGTPIPLGEWDGNREIKSITPNDRAIQKTTRARMNALFPVGEWGVVEPSIYFAQSAYLNKYFSEYGDGQYDSQEKSKGAEVQIQSAHGTTLGGSYQRDDQQTTGDVHAHVVDWALFANQDIQLGPLYVNPALRMDQHSTFGNTFNPRVGLVWGATDGLKLSGSAARSFHAPSFQDLYYFQSSNPNLQPETAWTYDAGLEKDLSNGNGVRATGYYTRIRDRIAKKGTIKVNESNAELSGLELEMFNRISVFQGRTVFAYTRSIGNSVASSEYKPLAFTPRRTASQELTASLPNRWMLRNFLQYVDRQFQEDGETGPKMPSYTLWNFGVLKSILSAEFFVGVDNITDKHYVGSVSYGTFYPMPGRTYRMSVSIRFLN